MASFIQGALNAITVTAGFTAGHVCKRSSLAHQFEKSRIAAALFPDPGKRASVISKCTVVKVPEGWQWDAVPENGESPPRTCFIIPAENPIGVIGYCTGMNSTPLGHIQEIELLNAQGYSVVATSLPFADPHMKDFFPISENHVESFFFDQRSPFYTAFPAHLPRIATTHSASGMIFRKLLLEKPEVADKVHLPYARHVNPFFDAAHSSEKYNPRINAIYSWYGKRHPSDHIRATLLGRINTLFSDKHNPQHENLTSPGFTIEQGTILRDAGRALVKKMDKADIRPSGIDEVFIIGDGDGSACPKVGRDVAKLCGIRVIPCKAGHSMANYPVLLESLIHDLQDHKEDVRKPERQLTLVHGYHAA